MPSGMRTASDILFGFMPGRMTFRSSAYPRHYSIGLITSIPSFAADLFFASLFVRLVRIRSDRSTGSKQTLNGLFICTPTVSQLLKCLLSFMIRPLQAFTNPALLYPAKERKFADGYIKSLKFCFDVALLY